MELVEIQAIDSHEDKVWALAWHSSGKILATGSSDKLIKIWAVEKQSASLDAPESTEEQQTLSVEHKAVLDGAHTRTIRSLAWKPDCDIGSLVLASSSFDATACLWQQDSDGDFEPQQMLEGHENEVKCVAWSPTGAYVATCSRDKSIWIFEVDDEGADVVEYSVQGVLAGHSQDVKYVKWHPERDQLFSASYDDTIKAWTYDSSVDDWQCKYTIRGGHESTVWSLAFDPSGQFLASCSEDKTWIVWSVSETGYRQVCKVTNTHFRAIYSLDWIQDAQGNSRIVTAGADNQIFVHSINQSELKHTQNDQTSSNVDSAAAQVSNVLQAQAVRPELLARVALAHESDINAVQFCPSDPELISSVADDGKLKLWRLKANKQNAGTEEDAKMVDETD